MSTPTPEQMAQTMSDWLVGHEYLRQRSERSRRGWRLAGWHRGALYPDSVSGDCSRARRSCWRAAGLPVTDFSEDLWVAACMLLPEIPSDRELFAMEDSKVREIHARVDDEVRARGGQP